MLDHGDDVKYAATVMSPNDISMGMLRKTPYNLYVLPSRPGRARGVRVGRVFRLTVARPTRLSGMPRVTIARSI